MLPGHQGLVLAVEPLVVQIAQALVEIGALDRVPGLQGQLLEHITQLLPFVPLGINVFQALQGHPVFRLEVPDLLIDRQGLVGIRDFVMPDAGAFLQQTDFLIRIAKVPDALFIELHQLAPAVGSRVDLLQGGEGRNIRWISLEDSLVVADLVFHRGVHSRPGRRARGKKTHQTCCDHTTLRPTALYPKGKQKSKKSCSIKRGWKGGQKVYFKVGVTMAEKPPMAGR